MAVLSESMSDVYWYFVNDTSPLRVPLPALREAMVQRPNQSTLSIDKMTQSAAIGIRACRRAPECATAGDEAVAAADLQLSVYVWTRTRRRASTCRKS